MAELQATIEISVELNRFFNVDLFQRGYYQIHVVLKTPLKSLARIEVSDNKINAQKGSPESAAAFKQSCTGKSRKFQILYRNEEVDIGDMFVFRINTLVESTKLEKNLENLDLRLEVQLWCNNEDELMESDAKMELASSRTLLLHLSPTKGLHHALPVLFDYFHLSAMEVVIHGTVIAIHQPYLAVNKSQKAGKGTDQSTLEAVYFGQKVAASVSPPTNVTSSSVRIQQAHLMHKTICNILLSAHESLQDYLQQYAAMIPGNNFQLACKDCLTRLGETVMKVQGVLEEDDLIQTALSDITQLCAENVILWAQFLEIVLKQPQVHLHLAMEHHNQRVRRFAEGFFTMEHNKSSCLSCYDPSFHGHSSLASMVKNSPYFCNLPSLPVECVELDGDENSLPVIFEDIFHDARASPPQVYRKTTKAATDGGCAGSSREHSSCESFALIADRGTPPHLRRHASARKFIKNVKPEGFKRPSSYYCSETEAVCAKLESTSASSGEATLIGYRKINVPDPSLTSHLERTYSFPLASSVHSLGLKHDSEAPAPNRSICHPASATTRPLTGVVSEPGLSNINKTSLEPAFKSATLTQSPSIYLKQTMSSSDSSLAAASYIPPASSDSTVSSLDVKTSFQSSSLSEHHSRNELPPLTAQENLANCPPELSKEILKNLVDDISHSLGEKELTEVLPAVDSSDDDNDDFSNGDTNIANGYDDVLRTYKQDFDNSQPSSAKASEPNDLTSQISESENQISSLLNTFKDLEQLTDSKNINNSALNSETFFQEKTSSTSLPSAAVKITQNSSAITAVSECAIIAETSTSVTNSYTDSTQKITVIELLKEEYRISVGGGFEPPVVYPSTIHLLTNPSESVPLSSQRAASDSDILKNCEEKQRNSQMESRELNKTSIDGNEKRRSHLTSSSSYPELSHLMKPEPPRLVSIIGHHTVNFVQLRETLKLQMAFPGYLYSECPVLASNIPYFHVPRNVDESSSGLHLIVCVHGLDGNSADLRLVRTYIEMALPGFKLEFLMSERNQQDTFADFDKMTDRLVDEILTFLDTFGLQVSRISFVGHSLGNIIIRSTLSRPEVSHLLPKLYTFLSLSGPHLGTLYNTSGLVNMGLWFMQKLKKSGSLLQLSLKDHSDPRQTFLYRLSQKPVLQNFKHVLLVGSHQDRYVPYHSSRIEICRSAQKDSAVIGAVYREMVQNILEPIIQSPHCTLIRYDVYHALPSTANTMIGRAAHIAVLDSEIFIEKFLAVTGLKYFQ